MKFLAIALLALSLAACRADDAHTVTVDTTLTCEMPQPNGETTSRKVRYGGEFRVHGNRHNIGWTYGEGAWVVMNRYWSTGPVYMTVTPRPGESCISD